MSQVQTPLVIDALNLASELCVRWEGFHRKVGNVAVPYLCPAGYWTIGYGHLCQKDHPPITEETARVYLQHDLIIALAATLRHCPSLARSSPGRLAAIIDFTFNLGEGRLRSSTLRRRINDGDWGDVPYQLRRWVWGGGRKLPGLVARREDEIRLL